MASYESLILIKVGVFFTQDKFVVEEIAKQFGFVNWHVAEFYRNKGFKWYGQQSDKVF